MSQINKTNSFKKLHKRKTRKEREEILRNRMGLQFLSFKELSSLKKIFKSLSQGNSYINKEEFDKALNSFGCSFDKGKLDDLFQDI